MPQLGEPVTSPDEFVAKGHDENTCPWAHDDAPAPDGKPMPEPDGKEDAPNGKVRGRNKKMPKNSGGTLGENLGDDDDLPDEVELSFVPTGTATFTKKGKKKVVWALFEVKGVKVPYDLQHAPHHLIPGDHSLKGSPLVAYLGDASVIKNFQAGGKPGSKITKGSAGYDVNCAENGIWLPSPYALSMGNAEWKTWASEQGNRAVIREFGDEEGAALEEYKYAYAVAAIKKSGGRQFHMVHTDYSAKVQEILGAIAVRVGSLTKCKFAKKKKDDKCDPPRNLRQRLNVLSENLRRFLSGGDTVWRSPMFTDALSEQYAKDNLAKNRRRGEIDKV